MQLALPLVLSTASWTIMHFVDRVFLARFSTEAIAAAMPSGILHFAIISLPLGIASFVTTFVAQYYGAGLKSRIGRIVWQGVFLGVMTVPMLLLLIPLAPSIFASVGHPPSVAELEIRYFQTLAYGGGATVISAALAAFFIGLGASRVVMFVDIAASLLNIVLDYLLIFGAAGLPEMGIAGAGVATSIALWVKVVTYALVMALPAFRLPYGLVQGCCWDRDLMRRLLSFGGPSGLQMFLEIAGFALLTVLMGQLGEVAMAATAVAFSVNSIAFVPMIGLGIAVSAMVGQQLGANRPDLAERATWTSFTLGAVYTGFMAVLYVAVPDWFLAAHTAGRSTEFAEVADLCRVLLRFVAAYCVIDMAQIVFSSAVKGAGDTRFVLATTAILAPFPALLGWFGLHRWAWGLIPFWYVITVWICLLGIAFYWRFQRGPWRRMRVIELDGLESDVPETTVVASQSDCR